MCHNILISYLAQIRGSGTELKCDKVGLPHRGVYGDSTWFIKVQSDLFTTRL